jgi:hypothetical protein
MPNIAKRRKLGEVYDEYRARGGNRYLPPEFVERHRKVRVAKFGKRAFAVDCARAACPTLTDKGIEELVLEPLAEILGFPPDWARSTEWWAEKKRKRDCAYAAWQEQARRELDRALIPLERIREHNAKWDSRRADSWGMFDMNANKDNWARIRPKENYGTPRGRIYQDNQYVGHPAAKWETHNLRGFWKDQPRRPGSPGAARSSPPKQPKPPPPRLVRGRPPKLDKLSRKEIQRKYRERLKLRRQEERNR